MEIRNLNLSYNLQVIFDDVSIFMPEKEKIGVIGPNGAGKTTLFKIIMGLITPDYGKIITKKDSRIKWLPQVIDEEVPSTNITVFEYLLEGRPIDRLNSDLSKCYEKVAISSTNEQNKIFKKIDEINNKLDYYESNIAEGILLKIIEGMNISSSLLDQTLSTLSGGQKSKVAFARLLYSKPEIILLDEPTNHLDKESKDYVINYLKKYKGTVLVISHDINFLNEVTNKTLKIDKVTHKLELFDGNYNTYQKIIKEREKSLEREVKKEDKEINKLRDIVLLYSNSSGKRKRMAQSREKTLNKMLKTRKVINPTLKNANIKVHMNHKSNIVPLEVENLSFKYNKESKNNLIHSLSFELTRGEKFLIVGQNGVGKSTLLKLIINELEPDIGSIKIGNKTEIGYYAQEHEALDGSKTVLENFKEYDMDDKAVRTYLGNFLFHGDDIYKKVKVLSPGERSRLALAKLSLKGANFLILDEPTNHLDPETQKIIGQTFSSFEGTMLIVSHNPEFVDTLGIERTLTLPSGKINYYEKDIVKYYEKLNQEKK